MQQTMRLLGVLLIGFIGLASVWSFTVPVYEAPDEPDHIKFAKYLAIHQALPEPGNDLTEVGLESTQGPLYYALAAAMLRLSGVQLSDDQPVLNPRFDFTASDPPNRFLAGAILDTTPVRIMRGLSIMGGLVTILATYGLARVVFAENSALCAAALVAFLPQFMFISSVASNDSLAAAGGATSLWLMAQWIQMQTFPLRRAMLLGITLGLAAIAKASLLALLPAGALALLWATRRSRTLFLKAGFLFAGALLIGGGWFFARNYYLYGSLLNSQVLSVAGVNQLLNRDVLRLYFTTLFPQTVFRSSIAEFGWMNITLPQPVYWLADVIVFSALLGLWLRVWQRRLHPLALSPWWVLVVAILTLVVSFVIWNLTYIAPQGRLLFGVLAAIAVIVVRGWMVYPKQYHMAISLSVGSYLILMNLYSLYWLCAIYASSR